MPRSKQIPSVEEYKIEYAPEAKVEVISPIKNPVDGIAEVSDGNMQSEGYVRNKRGWRLSGDGTAEFKNLKIGQRIITADSSQDIVSILQELSNEGGGVIQLKAGTYNIESQINIPSFVEIRGENKYTTILNFGATANNVNIAGSGIYTTGTVSITSGTTVTGSGTAWLTNAAAGQQIFLDNRWYLIGGVASDTSIVLAESYGGAPLSGATYRIATIKRDIELSEITIAASTATGLAISDCRNIIIEDVLCYANGAGGASLTNVSEIRTSRLFATGNTTYGIKFNKCAIGDVTDTLADGNTTNGITIDDVKYILFPGGSVSGNTEDGINVTTGQNLLFLGLTIGANGSQGMELVSGNNVIVVQDTAFTGNVSDGIKLTATADASLLTSNSYVLNGGYGINIVASTCDDNVITSSYFAGNVSGSINDSGTGTIKEANSPATLNASSTLALYSAFFGDGSDGTYTLDGTQAAVTGLFSKSGSTYTLLKNAQFQSLTIDSGVTLETGGYYLWVRDTITGAGTIQNNGGSGGNGGNGVVATSGGTAGTAGSAAPGGYLTPGLAGKAGGAGGFGGAGGSNGTNGTAVTNSLGSAGVAGGNGGAVGATAGGTSGTAGALSSTETVQVDQEYSNKNLSSASQTTSYLRAFGKGSSSSSLLSVSASSGSGGGGASGSLSAPFNGAGGGGGGSGAPGGIVAVLAKIIGGTLTFRANGGNGGNGGNGVTDGFSNHGGGGGGGGGGSGGVVLAVYSSLAGGVTIQATGGTKGTGGTASGGTGVNGSNGTDGGTGKVYKLLLTA